MQPQAASLPAAGPSPVRARVAGLDGLRGLAALYVVLHHCWLLSFRGYPANTGPFWVGWMVYGHLAVVFFLTLSGFSLAVAPAVRGWRLGGVRRFASRRAWRILPPYWAALLLSGAVAWTAGALPHVGPTTGRSILVYGLLLQDVTTAPVPNGAFWSIAVEAELYVVFPLLLLLRRRLGAVPLALLAVLPVIAAGLLFPSVSTVDRLTWLTPQLAPLFVAGLLAAGIAASAGAHRVPWHWLTLAAALPVLVLVVANGSAWTVDHYYWIDLAVAPAIALLLAAVTTGHPQPLVRLLATRPIRSLGSFSYSLYLIHVPVVVLVNRKLAAPHLAPGLPTFWLTLALAVPLSLLTARLFAAAFEIPFQRHRGWPLRRVGRYGFSGRGSGGGG